MQPTAASKGSHSRGDSRRGRLSLRRCHRGFTEGAVVAKTPPNSGKRTIIGGRKAQIGPFSGMRGAARKTLRQNPRSENCATEARLPAESPTTDYRRFARIRPLFSNKGGAPMQGEKQFIPIWIKDARRGGRQCRESGQHEREEGDAARRRKTTIPKHSGERSAET